jgi:hypothetical protein
MNEEQFWNIIEQAKATAAGNLLIQVRVIKE